MASGLCVPSLAAMDFLEVSREYIRGAPVFDVDISAPNGERWCFYIDIHTGAVVCYHRDD